MDWWLVCAMAGKSLTPATSTFCQHILLRATGILTYSGGWGTIPGTYPTGFYGALRATLPYTCTATSKFTAKISCDDNIMRTAQMKSKTYPLARLYIYVKRVKLQRDRSNHSLNFERATHNTFRPPCKKTPPKTLIQITPLNLQRCMTFKLGSYT